MSIRGIYSTITDIRRQVFTEVARMGYEGGDYSRIDRLPYKIVPGSTAAASFWKEPSSANGCVSQWA